MLISDHTLLLAIGFSALCVVVMFLVTWFSTRSEPFLLTWAAGTGVVVFSAFGFAVYNVDMTPWVGTITFGAMVVGLGLQFSAAIQFRTGRLPILITGPVILLGLLAVANAMFSGYNGLAIMIGQGFAAFFMIAAAIEYWRARAEAPVTLTIMGFLSFMTGAVFSISCTVLILDGHTVLSAAPRNWAETLGRSVTIVTVIGMGSIALVLNHRRSEKRRAEATQAG
jgi:prepilin signal peptidase PulO-like enzyme (type II secretory pathway)